MHVNVLHLSLKHVHVHVYILGLVFGTCLWWFHYPGLVSLVVSLPRPSSYWVDSKPVHQVCYEFESHLRQLIFFGKMTTMGVLCCFALNYCLFDLACFFLPSFSSLIMYIPCTKGCSIRADSAAQAQPGWSSTVTNSPPPPQCPSSHAGSEDASLHDDDAGVRPAGSHDGCSPSPPPLPGPLRRPHLPHTLTILTSTASPHSHFSCTCKCSLTHVYTCTYMYIHCMYMYMYMNEPSWWLS